MIKSLWLKELVRGKRLRVVTGEKYTHSTPCIS